MEKQRSEVVSGVNVDPTVLAGLRALSGTVYRLASSMSDHTPVLFNVFEDWNEESVVLHISFDSTRIRFERKRPIRRPLTNTYM